MAWSGRIVSALTALLLLQSVCGCSKEPDAASGGASWAAHNGARASTAAARMRFFRGRSVRSELICAVGA